MQIEAGNIMVVHIKETVWKVLRYAVRQWSCAYRVLDLKLETDGS